MKSFGRHVSFGLLGAACVLGATLAERVANAEPRTIHSEKSLYRNIFVTQDGDLRCLTFRRATAGTRQTCITLKDPLYLFFPYARMMMGALYLNPNPKRVLIIGLGGGTLPMGVHTLFPDAEVDVVEIDAAVVKAAHEYFSFKDDPKLKVHVEDGRVFVKKTMKTNTRFDLVMLDAFEDDYIPEHLLTQEFLKEVKSIMAPGGVIAANTFSSSGLYPYESVTYASVFGKFYNLKAANRVIWAQNGELASQSTVDRNATALEEKLEVRGVNHGTLMLMLNGTQDWPADTRLLTDQYSPSNILNSHIK
jgi:spermidine synthase